MNNEHTVLTDPHVAPPAPERRYVYNGETQRPDYENIQRGNRPVRKRKRSPFNIVIILFAISIVIVVYIWNKISVNRLAVEVGEYTTQYENILHANANLQADISKKSTLERIGRMAAQLGMTPPGAQPFVFTFDDQRLSRLDD